MNNHRLLYREIQIGEKSKWCSWTRVFTLPESHYQKYGLSENKDSFVGSGVFGVYFHLHKETPDGKKLVQLLEKLKIEKESFNIESEFWTVNDITNHIEGFTFLCLTIEDIINIVDNVKRESFRDGQVSKINEIKKVLEIHE